LKKQGQETKTKTQQLQQVDCDVMLVKKGWSQMNKNSPSYGQNGQLVQSWGLVHFGLDCQTWTLFYKKLLDSTTISNM
jgi:hypothetical protein